MRRPLSLVFCFVLLGILLAGCGGKKIDIYADPPPGQTDLSNLPSSFNKTPEARNELRRAHLHIFMLALYAYSMDHNQQMPPGLTKSDLEICAGSGAACKGKFDLSPLLSQQYLKEIFADPQAPAGTTSYYVRRNPSTARLTLSAPLAELGKKIEVTQ